MVLVSAISFVLMTTFELSVKCFVTKSGLKSGILYNLAAVLAGMLARSTSSNLDLLLFTSPFFTSDK